MAEFTVYNMSLTLTSFMFKARNSNESLWVDRVFGSKAVHKLKDLSVINGTASFRNSFVLPKDALHPKCSLELLGFAKLGLHEPFTQFNSDGLNIGNGSIVLAHPSIQLPCFYRGIHENWRPHNSYWPVLFYCPSPHAAACSKIRHFPQDKKMLGRLTMSLKTTEWVANFTVNPSGTDESTRMLGSTASSKPIATCLAIPYRSSDPKKETVNGALLFEWVRYYTSLGLKVIIYDKDGHNHDAIFNSTYGNIQGKLDGKNLENVLYHPFTIHGLLQPTVSEMKYDNGERGSSNVQAGLSAEGRMYNTDDDKTSTLTQCRFEANALYGIDNVFVSDFDEFLYCPNAAPTHTAQRHWLEYLTTKAMDQKADHIIATPKWLALKSNYTSPTECMNDKINQRLSVFECFAPFAYDVNSFFIGKSIHYGLKCPLTDFHGSCGSSDCACPTQVKMLDNDRCYLIHLSTNEKDYAQQPSNQTKREFESLKMELWYTMKSKSTAS